MTEPYIDVSHPIEDGLITYRGLPPPLIRDYLSREESHKHYAPGTEFHIGRIEMVGNTGTYIDSPFHRYRTGKDLSQLSLRSLANLDGIRVDVPSGIHAIEKRWFEGVEIRGKAILVYTGWDRYWNTDQYFQGHPYLTKESAELLAHAGAGLVGIDSLNIDSTNDPSRPAHSILLGADIPIVEHLCNLNSLPQTGFRFFAVPVMIRNLGSFPVRAFAIVS